MSEEFYGVEVVREAEGMPDQRIRIAIPELEYLPEEECAELIRAVVAAVEFAATHSEEFSRHRNG